MIRDDLLGIIRKALASSLGYEDGEWDDQDFPEDVTPTDLGMDSLDLVDFFLTIETRLLITVSDEDADRMYTKTIGEMATWLMEVANEQG